MSTGHPRHQLRVFSIRARHGNGPIRTVKITTQTEHDAILRAGVELARSYPSTDADATSWMLIRIQDPAPAYSMPDGN